MPAIRVQDLMLGRGPESDSSLSCRVEVAWQPEEVRAGEPYVLRVYLIEWDHERDFFRVEIDGRLTRVAVNGGNADEWWLVKEHVVRPTDGTQFAIRASGPYREQEAGPGEFYARGTIAPQRSHVADFVTQDIVIRLD
ncbi:MAG: hypothetical protein IPM29_23195 [Planctomycetes bacterium]|nr:hypothetical protein [Planctomycetota bacterium]